MVQETKPRILTPAACRGARGLLAWSQSDLAERAEVSRSTIKDYETGAHDLHRASATLVRRAFEDGGVTFLEVEGLGVGLFLTTPGGAPRN
ncbi:helix-turn-helix transcriptional regulator [Methylobrevis pamukkalensis]|nr:helix-turn-helix transcriptional regulator [Methylobrevis pamukkalensis]